MISRLVSTLAAAFLLSAFASQAANKSWTGAGVTASWSEGSNWLDGAAPASGDRLIFFQGPRSTNDLAGMAFSSVVVGTNGHAIDGAPVILTSTQPVELARGGSATFGGGVQLSAGRIVIATAHAQVNFLGPIAAPQGCTLALGVGAALIAGTNACILESTTSLLEVRSTAGLGPGRVTITQGTLRLGDPAKPGIFVTNPISMRGLDGIAARIETRAQSGSVDFVAPIDMDGDVEISAGADTNIRDSVGGLGHLTLAAADSAVLTLSGAVSPHGGLEIAHGRVAIGAMDLPRDDDLAIDMGGRLELGSFVKSVGALRCAGELQLTPGPGMLVVNKPSTLAGCILGFGAPARFSIPAGGEITLIRNASGVAFDGVLAGLPEGTQLTDADGVRAMVTYHGGAGHDVALVAATGPSVPPLVQDMWWSGPIENGWGMSLVQHGGNIVFGALYIYDAAGKPTWLVMPGGSWNAADTAFTGALYAPRGTPYYAYDARQFVAGSEAGSATITFQDPNHAILDYTVNGVRGRKVIAREIFASGAATRGDHSDLWWGGASQNGWGLTLLQQADTIFGVWYTYDAAGAPTWYVLPVGAWTSNSVYEGHLYRTTGSPWIGRDYDPAQLRVFDAGTYRLTFTGDTATFEYSADGKSGTLAIERQPF